MALCAMSANAAVSVPYVNSFDDQSQFDQMTAVNGDGGSSSWKYNTQSANRTSMSSVANDWLLTPEITLAPGITYRLKFSAWSSANNYRNTLRVKLGKGLDTAAYTTELCDALLVDRKDTKKETDITFEVQEEDDYRIGIQLTETVFFGGVFVDDIEITQAQAPSVAQAPEMTVVPGERGALNATVSVVAPETLTDGTPVSSLSKIVVRRGDAIVGTAENPLPGQTCVFNDDGAGMTDGFQTYTAAACIGATEGLSAINRIWVGKDEAKAPVSFIVTDNADGSTHARWELPATGVHEGYVDPEKVSYRIYQKSVDGDLLLTTLTGPADEYDFNLGIPDDFRGQQMVVFSISSVSGEYESAHTESNEYIIGNPYALPLYESFPDCQPEAGIWIVHSGEYDWSTVSDVNYDGDNGAVYLSIHQGTDSYANSIESGKIDLSTAVAPGVVFRYLAYPGSEIVLKVLVRRDGGSGYECVSTIDYTALTGTDGEWRNHYVDLSGYKDSRFVTLSFEATVADYTKAAVVDAIEVRDIREHDMLIGKVELPATLGAGRLIPASFTVVNAGLADDAGGTVSVAGGRKTVEVAYPPVKAFSAVKVQTEIPTSPLAESAHIEMSVGDVTADAGTVVLTEADLAAPANLTAPDSDKAALQWDILVPVAEPVTDDFENYEPFTISEFSPWRAVDRDMLPSTALAGTYPHKGEAYPFIIFNPESVGIPVDGAGAAFKPVSGRQFLAAVAGDGDNDDWRISEELSGDAQTVALMARSYNTQYGPELLEVLYSEGSLDPEDFMAPDGDHDFAVPAEWTRYEVTLPVGAKRFALHYKSGYNWMLMIDDVEYTPAAPEIEGYNIYRNREVIATVESPEHSFLDGNVGDGDHVYNVTALYRHLGESALSNDVTVSVSAIEDVLYDRDSDDVTIYTPAGVDLYRGKLSEAGKTLPVGIYIAVGAHKSFKVVF